MLVGEVGIERDTFLYRLKFWEIRAIERGYRKRSRKLYELCRWQTFWLMHTGMADVSKLGIHTMSDLMPLPWDDKDFPGEELTDDQIEKEREKIRAENKKKEAAE